MPGFVFPRPSFPLQQIGDGPNPLRQTGRHGWRLLVRRMFPAIIKMPDEQRNGRLVIGELLGIWRDKYVGCHEFYAGRYRLAQVVDYQ